MRSLRCSEDAVAAAVTEPVEVTLVRKDARRFDWLVSLSNHSDRLKHCAQTTIKGGQTDHPVKFSP